jgi:hypothetical protein
MTERVVNWVGPSGRIRYAIYQVSDGWVMCVWTEDDRPISAKLLR